MHKIRSHSTKQTPSPARNPLLVSDGPERLKQYANAVPLLLHNPPLRQGLDNPTIKHCSISPRESDLISQILGQQSYKIPVPVAVQSWCVLKLGILVVTISVFGYAEFKMKRYNPTSETKTTQLEEEILTAIPTCLNTIVNVRFTSHFHTPQNQTRQVAVKVLL